MFCSNCGTKNDSNVAAFCVSCGTALARPAASQTVNQTYAPPAADYYQQPQAASSGAAKPVLANLAIVFSCVSLFFLPVVFGPAAFILGIIAVVQKQKNAVVGLVLSCIFPFIGFAIGYSIALNSYGY